MITAPLPENQLSFDETFDLILSGFSFSLKKIRVLRSDIESLRILESSSGFSISPGNDF